MTATTDFNAEQAAAIEAPRGDLLLAAGAGSGKTRVMVERFARAAAADDGDPARLLAITFTERATAELVERVLERVPELADDGADALWVSTIHGFCARLLRAHALAAGLDPGFAVADDAEAAELRGRAFHAGLDELVERHGEAAVELAAAHTVATVRQAVLGLYDELRSRGEQRPALPPLPQPRSFEAARAALEKTLPAVRELLAGASGANPAKAADGLEACLELLDRGGVPTPGALDACTVPNGSGRLFGEPAYLAYREARAALCAAAAEHHARPQLELFGELLTTFGGRYEQLKRQHGLVDFADLELLAVALLRGHPEIAERYRERFDELMVDEFQDTNALQLELLELLDRGNLFTVGDEHQSIYGFRHADVQLFRRRRDELAARGGVRTLATNYRSRAEILAAVAVLFAGRGERSFAPLVPGRSEPPSPDPVVELVLVDREDWTAEELVGDGAPLPTTAWRVAEARALAARVRELVDAGVPEGEIALLFRAGGDIPVYERALADRGLATYVAGGSGYWSRPEVRDLLAHLNVLANPRDGLALYTALGSPLAGISSDAMVAIAAAARAEPSRDPWWVLRAAFGAEREPGAEAALGALDTRDRKRLGRWVPWIEGERRAAARLPVADLIERALLETRYDLAILRMPAGARRLANVRKLARIAAEHEASAGGGLRAFADHAARLAGSGGDGGVREGEALLATEELAAVKLMTMHRAKGLEFGVVCVADLAREPILGGSETILVGEDGRVGLRLRLLDGASRPPAVFAHEQLAEERRAASAAEEDRLLYVAMTRARDRLILSGAIGCGRMLEGTEPRGNAGPIEWVARRLLGEPAPFCAEGDAAGTAAAEAGGHRVELAWTLTRPGGLPERPPRVAEEPEPVTAELQQLELASARGPAQPRAARLSYTALGEHARCAYRFYLERVLGLPALDEPLEAADEGAGLSALARGRVVHELLERIDPAATEPPARDEFEARAEGRLSDDDARELAGLVGGLLTSETWQRLARAPELRREARFALSLPLAAGPPALVVGAFDALAHEPGGALVVDYKTDRLGERTPEEAAAGYGVQRLVYALAALSAGAPAVEVAHVFLERPDEPAIVRHEAAERPELERRLAAAAAAALGDEFPVAAHPDRWLCNGCPGRGALCSWPRETTEREPGETG